MKKMLRQIVAAALALGVGIPLLMTPLSAAAEDDLYHIAKARVLEAWENFDTSVYVGDLALSYDEAVDLYFDVLFTNGEYFYVRPGVAPQYSLTGEYIKSLTISYTYAEKDVPAMQEEMDAAVDAIMQYCDNSWSNVEKLLYFHDCLTSFHRYNQDETDSTRYDAYNLLVEGMAVCQGYTLALNVLCNRVGIPNTAMHSVTLKHIWNVVQLDGEWYHIDATHDDALPNRLGRSGHNYLLCSDAYLMADSGHQADDWKSYDYGTAPICSSTLFDDAIWKDSRAAIVPYENGTWLACFPITDNYQYASNIGFELCMFDFNTLGEMHKRIMYTHYDYWPVGSTHWPLIAAYVDYYNNNIYFNDHNTIYRYSASEGAVPIIMLGEEDDAQYDIYGMCISDTGLMQYQLSPAPNTTHENTLIYTFQLEQPAVTTTPEETTTTTTTTTSEETTTTTTTTTPEETTTTTTTTTPEKTTTTTTTTTPEETTTTTTTTTPEETTTTTTTTTTPEETTTTTTTTTATTPEVTTVTTSVTTTETTTTSTTTSTTTTTTTTTTVPPEPTRLGDLNHDDMVTIVDVILLNRCLAEDTSIAVDAQALANSDLPY